jgi:hypothetical protein
MTNVNEAGKVLSAPDREIVFGELSKCFPKVGQLLDALAHED